MKKRVAIVFGITDNYTFALANVLLGMKKHCNQFWDDIIVYHDGIGEQNQNNINKIFPCQFRKLDLNMFSKNVNEESLKSYSYLCAARFECFDMLNEYEYVIWHDVDILIQKDFSTLLKCADDTGFALTCDPRFFVEQNFFAGDIAGYDLLKPLYNSGIMVIKDNLLGYRFMRDYCYQKFNDYAETLRYLDQAVLNMLIQDYKIKVGYIPLDTYCCHPTKNCYKNAVIVHAYGTRKFWNSLKLKRQFPEWQNNNAMWKRIESGENIYELNNESIEPKVSAILYICGAEDYTDASIISILNQSYSNFELIIVIEKTNEQQAIVNCLNSKYEDNRIVLLCNDTKCGYAESLNRGIDKARGVYVARVDGKTISIEARFKKQIEFLEKHKDISVIGSYVRNFDKVVTIPSTQAQLQVYALTKSPVHNSTVIFRKQDFIKFGIQYEHEFVLDDYEVWSVAIRKLQFANIREVLLIDDSIQQEDTLENENRKQDLYVNIVQENFRQNLDVELSYDEVVLIVKPEIINKCYNAADFRKKRESAIEKIRSANIKCAKYDHDIFIRQFGTIDTMQDQIDKNKLMLQSIGARKLVLWGTGIRCKRYLSQFPDVRINFCIDNDISKRGQSVCGIPISYVEDVENWDDIFVIITPADGKEIGIQLEEMGLEYKKDFAFGSDFY